MTAKVHWLSPGRDLSIFCPACRFPHNIIVDGSRGWKFDGDEESPTISPSIKLTSEHGDGRKDICHSFVRNGVWEYCGDSTHEHAGKILPVPVYPENWK